MGSRRDFVGRYYLPYRFSSQLLFFMAITVTLAALLVGGIFTFHLVKFQRERVAESISFLAKNIDVAASNLIITRDLSGLEEILLQNASFPIVEAILITDSKGKILSQIEKSNDKFILKFSRNAITANAYEIPFDLATGKPVNPGILSTLFPPDSVLEIWYPINAGSLLGNIRIRYTQKDLHELIISQWQHTLLYATLTAFGVFLLFTLVLRKPMRALHETTIFASQLSRHTGGKIAIYAATKELAELMQALNSLSLQLNMQQTELNERIAHNQTILDNVIDGIITLDVHGKILSFNLAACQIFGHTTEQILNQSIQRLILNSQAGSVIHQNNLPSILGQQLEVEGVRQDGSIFPMDIAVSRSTDHEAVIYIAILRDITERRRLDRLKSEFVATVSHELRTPLTSIYGSLKLVESGVTGVLPEAALKLISLAQKNSNRLNLLINDLLDMEKLAAGKMVLNFRSFNLTECLKLAIEGNAGYADAYHVHYQLEPVAPEEDHMVTADPDRVAQVLANLLSNAAKFSNGAETVLLRMIRLPEHIRIEVEDFGSGIPLHFQTEIFKAFAQANNGNTRNQGGTGLGLKICQSLIQAMQGEIGFHSRPGSGTTFWFTLKLSNTLEQ